MIVEYSECTEFCARSHLQRGKHQTRDLRGTVKGWNGVAIVPGVLQQLEQIIAANDTRRDNIVQGRHGGRERERDGAKRVFSECKWSSNHFLWLFPPLLIFVRFFGSRKIQENQKEDVRFANFKHRIQSCQDPTRML